MQRATVSQLSARLPLGMLSLAVRIDVETRTGSYALAGAVVACISIDEASATPLTARLAGVVGSAQFLLTAATVNAATLIAMALTHCAAYVLLLGLIVGASVPPIMPVLRALYPRLVKPEALRTVHSGQRPDAVGL